MFAMHGYARCFIVISVCIRTGQYYYESLPIQNAEIFSAVKIEKFKRKKVILIFMPKLLIVRTS